MGEFLIGVLDISIRALVSAIILFLLTKIMGYKQISQLTYFDYCIGISIGSIAAEMSFDREQPYHYFVIAMTVYFLIAVSFSLITLKSLKLRKFLNGNPIILMDKGKLLPKNMKIVKVDIHDFLAQCRNAGYFNIDDLEYAIMEPNGLISFLPKSKNRPLTTNDMALQVKQDVPGLSLIMDGVIMRENLTGAGLDENWLASELLNQGFISPKQVFYATLNGDNQLVVFPKNQDMYKHTPYS
ncbi:MAG: DUF421 domain-containing protein [Clostridiales bacterium]